MTPVDAPLKSRHGCLTAYLLFLMITNGISAIFLLNGLSRANNTDGAPIGWKLIFISFTTLCLAGSVGLWKWRRWGFWLYLFSTFVIVGLEVFGGASPQRIAASFAVLIVLYAALQIGGKRNGWKQLE